MLGEAPSTPSIRKSSPLPRPLALLPLRSCSADSVESAKQCYAALESQKVGSCTSSSTDRSGAVRKEAPTTVPSFLDPLAACRTSACSRSRSAPWLSPALTAATRSPCPRTGPRRLGVPPTQTSACRQTGSRYPPGEDWQQELKALATPVVTAVPDWGVAFCVFTAPGCPSQPHRHLMSLTQIFAGTAN